MAATWDEDAQVLISSNQVHECALQEGKKRHEEAN